MVTVITKSLTEEINEWIPELNDWEQYLACKILNKQPIKKAEIQAAYQYFLEDNGLSKKNNNRSAIQFPNNPSSNTGATNFLLKEIKGIKGVNALKDDQSILISKNLSIIYGDNGVGKSGYIRIMNNAFLSRGDKSIVENIYSATKPKETSCIYKFIKDDTEYELKYPDHADNYEFSCYAVFDTLSVSAHLNREDEIQFLPNGLDFFDSFSKAVEDVKALLVADYTNKTPENPFLVYFIDKDTTTKKLIGDLSGNTDIKVVREKATLSLEEIKKLSSLEKKLLELRKTDVPKKVKSLRALKSHISQLKDNFEAVNSYFTETSNMAYKKLVEDYGINKDLSTKEGLAQFKTELISNTGNREWKNLITAAKEFADTQYTDEDTYPEKGDVCLLCRQPLSKEAKTLIEAYWKFLSSNAEKELKKLTEEIEQAYLDLKNLDTKQLSEESQLYEWLSENAEADLKTWTAQIKMVENLRTQIMNVLKTKKWKDEIIPKQISIKSITGLEKSIIDKILGLNENEINKNIKDIEKEINEFNDRKKLPPLLTKIEEYINKHSWALQAQKKVFSTRKITSKQKELFTKYVTEEYIKTFNKECEKLNSNFGIEVSQRSQKGNTLKHLILKGKAPSSILSEGEQRAISIADFLTEIQIGNKNKGIIFDDPVNSLDHIRRQIIAERVIEESKNRQVIIFTHDLTFFLALQALAEEKNIECLVTSIRKIGNIPGIVNNSIPWLASNVGTRIKKLNEMLQELKKSEKGDDPDKYSIEAKAWTGLLRETWERSIEEKLFNDAIQRFSPSIQTKRLEKAKFTPALYKEVEKGMTDCSNWVHDQSRAINTPTPDTIKLESFLNEFKIFVQQFNNK